MPEDVTLAISIDDNVSENYTIQDRQMHVGRLSLAVSPQDATMLASRALTAMRSFAAEVTIDGGRTKLRTSQTMTGAKDAIGGVLAACR